MVYAFDGFNDFVRLDKGERLSDFLKQFSTDHKDFPGAWLSGLGGVQEVTLGFYDLQSQEYMWKTFAGLREMTALQGNLAYDKSGKLMLHAHGTFADDSFQAIGGHIKDFIVAGTVELFVHRSYRQLTRKMDSAVGLQTFNL